MPSLSSPTCVARARSCEIASAWALTGILSPRPTVRVIVHELDGELLNSYEGSRRTSSSAPETPWAMYLADRDRRYRYLAFDLDAKGERGPADADRDARALAALLHSAGLAPLICESGPSGGRHVWVGLAETVDAETVATLARLARRIAPTLDIAPLTNPATGCVRPPGAPHRHGGSSRVLTGLLDWLTYPTGTAAQVHAAVEHLAELHTEASPAAAEPTTPAPTCGPLPVDHHGRLYLPGPKRPLPASAMQALHGALGGQDASAVLWRVLIGAVGARWRFVDIAALVDSAPGLEHVRSRREGGRRVRRARGEVVAVLRRQWDKAVRWVSARPRLVGADPTFDARAEAVAAHVRGVQERADASPGRWVVGGGPSDRRVLDALCVLALEAVEVVTVATEV